MSPRPISRPDALPHPPTRHPASPHPAGGRRAGRRHAGIRCVAALAALLAAALGASPTPAAEPASRAEPVAAQPITVRAAVTIAGPALLLGDIFANIGDKAGIRIGDAPAAGSSLALDAGRLAQLALRHGLAWRPASTAEKAVVERDSVAVTADEVGARVLLELTRKGLAGEQLSVEPMLGTRQLWRPRNAELAIDAVTTDPAGRRFSAILAIVAEGQARQTLPVSGRLDRAVTLPVLSRAMRPDEVIGAADVTLAEVSGRNLPTNAVRDAGALVGHAARRALAPGQMVLLSDLRSARLVSKGQPVMLVLAMPGMQLTAGGVAQADGGEGDRIPVVNERSRSIVTGVVTQGGTVLVQPGGSAMPAAASQRPQPAPARR